jgi:hypothetical protein
MGFSDTHEIAYWLPVSALRLTGTRTATVDKVLSDAKSSTTWASTAELRIVADQAGPQLQAKLQTGWLNNTNVELAFSEDGRLTSAGSDTSGAAVPLLKGVVVAGAAVVGFLVAGGPGAALAASGAIRRAVDALELVELHLDPDADREAPEDAPAERDPVMVAYERDHRQEALLLELSIRQVGEAEKNLAAARGDAIAEPSFAKLADLRRREEVLRSAREEFGRLRRHFDLWRASKVSTRSETFEHAVTIDELHWDPPPALVQGKLVWGKTAPAHAQSLWQRFGLLPVATPLDGAASPEPAAAPTSAYAGVYVRRPRRVQITIYRRTSEGDGWEAELVSSQVHDIVDGRSAVVQVPFRSSAWSRRRTVIELSEAGTLAHFEHTTTASGQEIGTALGELPASIVSGLEQAGKLRDQLDTLKDKDRELELARTKRDVAIKKDQLELAGLTATEGDYAELKRLEQQVSLLEQRRGVATATATSDDVAGEIARLTQQLQLATTGRELRTEEALGELKIALEQARTIAELLAKAKET